MTTSESHSSGQVTASGPLTVSAANPRYFTAAAGDTAGQKAVYLTGSHIWNFWPRPTKTMRSLIKP